MTKYILIGGYLQKAPDEGKALIKELVKGFVNKPVKILDCVFADPENAERKFEEDNEKFSKYVSDFALELAIPEKFLGQVKSSDIVFFRGGDTEILMNTLNKYGDWVFHIKNKTVAGTSAGAMALARYSHALTKDEIIEGLGILPVKIITHWQSESYKINWDKALEKLKNYKKDLPIYTLKEGEYKIFEI